MANPSIQLGTNSNWAIKEDKLLAYKEYNDYFFNKEFDFTRGSTATYVGRDGLIASAASGVPRIDFTNDTKGHLLLEPQSTNLLQRSNQFLNAYWSKTNITLTANSETSPDGTNNAFLLDVGTANGDHALRKTALSPTATYTVSIFAKKGSTDYVWFMCGGSAKGVQAIFDLSDGSVTDSGTVGSGQTLVAAKTVDMGNGWYRLIIEAETTDPPGFNLSITPYYQSTFSGNIATSWQGNNETIYIYGAMNEENSFATSYIPTTDATSTRNADVCNNSGSAQDFNDSEGVLYAEIAALTNEDDSHRLISISDGTVSNSIMISYRLNGNLNLYNNGTGSSESIYGDAGYDLTDNLKIAVKYGASKSDYRVYVNGVQKTVRAGFTATSISGLNTLRFEQGGGSNKFYGKVRNVQVFTEALTDAELQELTS